MLVLPLRVWRKIAIKGRLVRKPRKGSLDGEEICVKLCKVESVSARANEGISVLKENAWWRVHDESEH